MTSVISYFSSFFKGLKSLLVGMKVTIKEFFTPKVTEMYPENRHTTLHVSDRFRGELVMIHNENNEHSCTACGLCQMNCPNGTINIESEIIETEDGKKKKVLKNYFYDLGQCTFCNVCVMNCPQKAIEFRNTFENAVFRREILVKKLNHEGSKLKEKKIIETKQTNQQ